MVNTCSLIASSHRFFWPTHPFQAFSVPISVGLLGVKLHSSLSTGSTYHYSDVLLRLSVLWRYPIASLFYLHCTTRIVFFWTLSLSLARTAVDPGIWHSIEVDSLSVIGLYLLLLRLQISFRPDTLIFFTGEQISVFLGAICAVLLYWYLMTVKISPEHSALRCYCFCYEPDRTSEETLQR